MNLLALLVVVGWSFTLDVPADKGEHAGLFDDEFKPTIVGEAALAS